ncbi:hypothetical protein OSTOST_22139, partial [Ostertagia ostertagi]
MVFAFSAPVVYDAYLTSLSFKPCHTHVSISAAVSEYLCICVYDTFPREDLPDYSPIFMTSHFDSAPFAHLRGRKAYVHDLKCCA